MRALALLAAPLGLATLLCPGSVALAQVDAASDDMKAQVMAAGRDQEAEDTDGWSVSGKLGANFALNDNQNVVGTEDGTTLQLGGILSLDATLTSGQHGWKTTLGLQQTQTRTPQLERFVKSLDQLDLVSTYTFRFENPSWLGVFARLGLNTQIFEGELVPTDPTEVRRLPLGSSTDGLTPTDGILVADRVEPGTAVQSVGLTSPFEPLNLRQSLGMFADPVTSEAFSLSIKVGLAAQEVLTSGGSLRVATAEAANADGETVVFIQTLEGTVAEAGAETEVQVKGTVVKEIVDYELVVNAFYPPFTTSEVDRDFAEALNLKIKGSLSAKLNEWLSAEYVLTVLRIPATTTDFQIQNGLVLSVGFDLI